jgi:outer membrane protein assembly factor BamB
VKNPGQPSFEFNDRSAGRILSALVVATLFVALLPAPAAALVNPVPAPVPAGQDDGVFWFVFAADSHLGSPQGNRWADRVVDDIISRGAAVGVPPAFIVHGGDMTEFGRRAQYALYQESFSRVGVPVHGIPGNHEAKWADAGKGSFRYALGDLCRSFDLGGIHFVLLDTSLDGETYGHLERYVLDWLVRDLEGAMGRPAVVFCHHPVGYSERRFMDNDLDFFESVAPFDVLAVFTGHGHSALRWEVNGIPVFMAPAAMDGRYLAVSVSGRRLTVVNRSADGTEADLGTAGPPKPAARRPPVAVTARAAGASIGIAATVEGLPGAVAVEYRVNLGAWEPMAAVGGASPSTRFYAAEVTAPQACGIHAVSVRAVDDRGGAWIGSTRIALEATAGRPKRIAWKYEGRGGVQASPALAGDLLLVGSNDGFVTALRRSDGAVAWRFKANGAVLGQPVVSGRRAYFAGAIGVVYCVDVLTGALKWYYVAESAVASGVALSGKLVIVGTSLGWVHAIDAASGRAAWTQVVGGAVGSTPAPGAGRVFVGAWDGRVYALSQADGHIEWAATIDASPYYSAATGKPLVHDGRVFVTSAPNPNGGGYGVTALDAGSGAPIWRAAAAAAYCDPIMFDGMVAVTTTAGVVHLFDPETGEVRRTVNGGGACLDSSAVRGPRGTLVIGTIDGRIRVTAADGGPAGDRDLVVQLGDGFILAGVCVADDMLYACTMDGSVYAISTR